MSDKNDSNDPKHNQRQFAWLADNLDDIKKIAMSIIFIAGLGYMTLDWLSGKFVTKLDADDYALKKNVSKIDRNLAKVQIFVLQNELTNARKLGIEPEDKAYLQTVDKQIFKLKIKLDIYNAKESDYKTPSYLKYK